MAEQKRVVAFMQNQWFPAKNVPGIEAAYARHGTTPEGRAKLNARYLFFRCLSGRRIRAAFGEELCNAIWWENASPRIASESGGSFPPDAEHMAAVLRHFRPAVVLTFGRPATLGFAGACMHLGASLPVMDHVESPHPAARHATVVHDLELAAGRLRKRLAMVEVQS